MRSKQREIELLRHSSIDWVALRPGLILDDGPHGEVELSGGRTTSPSVSRAAVARAALTLASAPGYSRRAPFVGSRPG